MKKRILALLLAGLLTASLSSCFQPGSQTENPTGGTEPQQTLPPENPTEEPNTPIVFTTVDETVYTVVDNAKLLVDPSTNVGSVQVEQITELHRIKVSAVWSVVEYMDTEYYVATSSLTKEDLLGKGFTACNPKTMYVKSESLNVRTYASSEKYSPIIKDIKLKRNDTVTVVAEGAKWSKIKWQGENNAVAYYFVFSEYLSTTEYVDPNTIDFSQYFEACNPAKTMYTTGSVNMRKNAHAESDVIDTFLKGYQVTVVALGTIGESTWAKVEYEIAPEKEGDPATKGYAYINARFLTENQGGETTITLEDILSEYPDFTKLEAPLTMYANGVCWVRSSPKVISQDLENGSKNPDFNGIGNLAKADVVKIVASGDEWVIIEMKTGEFGFVHTSMLTTDSNGEAVLLSLTELLKLYPEFSAITETTVYAAGKVNCYTEPKTNDTVPKTLEAGTQVTKVAVSEDGVWCIVKTADGAYYFAGSTLFTETAPAA